MRSLISRRARIGALAGLLAAGSFAALPHSAHAAPADDAVPQAPPIESVAEPALLFDVCPLNGPSTFEDSWGWARSGGRSHEGVDMIADRGVPVIAVRDGFAQFKTNGLGGRAIWLTAPNGDKFYYAHLDAWEGESRDVRAGELIGYVGSTGNAQGPHLHFETLPGGHVENPYGHTLQACVPTPAEMAAAAERAKQQEVWNRFLPSD
ncbi:M23 family metallopeptidase [Ilumatobacter nonamiensis]|uniref:M23 family metallopeptidase n=1 Tax=Ilumatobacter nonamiensis TaxID=467093 RepID=UPI00034AFBD5|nr:M23 family metallopeptidase [Ilumatobacter nonamiensis]